MFGNEIFGQMVWSMTCTLHSVYELHIARGESLFTQQICQNFLPPNIPAIW